MLKRSSVNQTISEAILFFKENKISLPPFAYWEESDFRKNHKSIEGILLGKLGWDVTDFGQADFSKFGRTIFTLRNGYKKNGVMTKNYAQKIMFMQDGQKSTIHYHKSKTEDIINVAGGNIVVLLWHKNPDSSLSDKPVKVQVDGMDSEFKPGSELVLTPGESVNLPPETYHQFWAQEGSGKVISMEVSSVNDDATDNFWLNTGARFPEIVEDEPRRYILCYEYEKIL